MLVLKFEYKVQLTLVNSKLDSSKINLTNFRYLKFSYPNTLLKLVYKGNYFLLMTCSVKPDRYSRTFVTL